MNKPRLIDANVLLEKLPYPTDYAESEFYGKVLDVIEELPTAYDIDEIVERLKDEIEKKDDWQFSNAEIAYWNRGIRKAIKIVKGGGSNV